MPRSVRPAIIVVAAGVVVLSLFVVFASREKHPVAAPVETPDPIAAETPPAPSEPPANPPAVAPGPRVLVAKSPDPARPEPLDEASLMTKLHDLAASDPSLSLSLAKEALARFPDSPNAPEFNWNLVKALFNMGRLEEAREQARTMVAKYPGNDFAGDVDHHLLHHPPNPTEIPDP